MSDELGPRLDRLAGDGGDPPDLDGLWSRGRARRRRGRLLAGGGAVAAVVMLVVGVVAFAGSSDPGEEVAAGPSTDVAAPPPEPDSGRIAMRVIGSDRLSADVAVVEPGVDFEVSVIALPRHGGLVGSGVLAWEHWDGATWSDERTLGFGEGDRAPVIAGAGATLALGPVPETEHHLFITPDDDPGWYRVCDELGPSPDLRSDGPPTATERNPCAQIRIPDPADLAALGVPARPPAEDVDGPIIVRHRGLEPGQIARVEGGFFSLDFEEVVQLDWIRGWDSDWEAWDGSGWATTHTLVSPGDAPGLPPRPTTHPSGSDVLVPWVAASAEGEVRFAAPPAEELLPGWYRVCTDVTGMGLDPPEMLEARPCVQVRVPNGAWPREGGGPVTTVGGGPAPTTELVPDDPGPTPTPTTAAQPPSTTSAPTTPPGGSGDAATWTVDPGDPPTTDGTAFTALVTRLGCNGGVTGEVNPFTALVAEDEIVVTFTVEAVSGPATCPGNDPVPYEVELSDPLGDRVLRDGGCQAQAATTTFCTDQSGDLRWPLVR